MSIIQLLRKSNNMIITVKRNTVSGSFNRKECCPPELTGLRVAVGIRLHPLFKEYKPSGSFLKISHFFHTLVMLISLKNEHVLSHNILLRHS